ncbi:MAG: glycerol-3-phosphate acyltransferase [Desulfobacteraceae bacterium]|nr:glycerol-3-phosphate acyltransferase [Desulfobacteraceae bacterium]
MPKETKKNPKGIKNKVKTTIRSLLNGTRNHFLFELPARAGLVTWLLGRLFTGIKMEQEHLNTIRKLPENAIVIYTIKFKSYFEFLFFHCRYRKENVRVPELGFGFRFFLLQPIDRLFRSILSSIDNLVTTKTKLDPYTSGYWRQSLLEGRTCLLPLIERHGFYNRFVKAKTDPLRFLIDLQNETDRPIYLVPHLMFFSKTPAPPFPRMRDILFGTEQNPGIMRRLFVMFKQPGRVFVEVSEPLALKKFISQKEIQQTSIEYEALMLRRKLLLQHNRHRQSITGPVLKSHEEMKESILANDRLRKFMAQQAKSRNEPLHVVRKKADSYLDEIAAKYSYSFVKLISKPVGWLLNTMFEGTAVDKEGIRKMKTAAQKGPVILLPCHKSHVDYLILSFLLFNHNMPCPHIAAGKNLSFWPMGPIFRATGAFFLRRTFRGAVLYAKVFSEYMHKLLEDGFNIEIFIEGGRSRSGKLLMPKLGGLSILLNAYKNGACRDLVFVPVFIGYDQVLEEDAYVHELEGGKKEPENLSTVLRARRFLARRYGKIYINFHDPIFLSDLMQSYNEPLAQLPQKTQNDLCRQIGSRTINAIDKVSVVTPYAIVAAAILNCPAKRFTLEDIFSIIETYTQLLYMQKARFSDTMLLDQRRACEQALGKYVQRKVLELPSGEKGLPIEKAEYILSASKRLKLEYYKNNCIAYFVPAAIAAMTILEKDAFQFSAADLHNQYKYLQNLLQYEFAYDIDNTHEHHVRKCLKAFIDDAILMPHATLPDTYQITSAGLRKLKLFARFLKPYVESYLVVLNYFKQTAKNSHSQKERIKRIQALGRTMLKKQEIDLPEAISKMNFENGITSFSSLKIRGLEDGELIEPVEKKLRYYLNCI